VSRPLRVACRSDQTPEPRTWRPSGGRNSAAIAPVLRTPILPAPPPLGAPRQGSNRCRLPFPGLISPRASARHRFLRRHPFRTVTRPRRERPPILAHFPAIWRPGRDRPLRIAPPRRAPLPRRRLALRAADPPSPPPARPAFTLRRYWAVQAE